LSEPVRPPNRFTRRASIITIAASMLAVPSEGIYRRAYYDPPGILTACMGHTGPDVAKGITYSLEQCNTWLQADMGRAVDQVERCQPGLPDAVLVAFADAVFNMGPTIACDQDKSTAARMLVLARTVTGDYSPACRQLPRWDKAKVHGFMVSLPGLTARRGKEAAYCLTATLPESP
jgi:lysozyme